MCENQDFDIVFMDIDMPIKNGIIATKEIKQKMTKGQFMPIIALNRFSNGG